MGARGPAPKAKQQSAIKFRPGVPPPPDWLSDSAKIEYVRAAEELEAADGALQQVDLAALASYAQAYAEVARITKVIATEGDVIASPQGLKANPRLQSLALAQRSLATMMQRLGFSPADRARVPKSGATGRPDNPFASFVK